MPITALMKKATQLYLYGKASTPTSSDLLSDMWIRPATAKSPVPLEIDLVSYMSTGGGRFAVGSKFDLIDKFFDKSNVIAAGTYTKEEMIAKFGMKNAAWSMKQLDYRDGTDDYAERVYVFNSCNFRIANGAQFVVKADGTRSIVNYAIEGFVDTDNGFSDDFNLVSTGITGNLGNSYLQPGIDPWNIGRTVDMQYINGDKVPRTTYTESNYAYDVAHENPGNGLNLSLALEKMDEVIQELWDSGVTKLIGSDGKPIMYGTATDDTLFADTVNTLTLYKAHFTNGVTVMGGAGKDYIAGTSYNDKLIGGIGIDTISGGSGYDDIIGGDGNDILSGGAGADIFFINNGDDVDTVTDADGSDRVNYNNAIVSGKATNLSNGNYKMGGWAMQKQGDALYITAGGGSGIVINKFFPAGYDEKQDYSFMGITIPKEKDDANDDVAPVNSPIALDLNGDGIKYISYNSWVGSNTLYDKGNNAHFDIDNDGFAEGMEWLNKNDGFLVRDLNGNGRIDNQKEMFGDDSGTTAYAKLALFDTNKDSKIDAADTGFANLKIWQDLDSDGRTDSGELKTLAEAGIASLSLQLTNATTDSNGHAIAGTSSFTRTNGTVGYAADVLLRTYQTDSIYVGSDTSVNPALDIDNLFLPLIKGRGTLLPMHYAMTQNAKLKTMVSDLGNINIATQMHEVYSRVNAIIVEWAGAGNIPLIGSDIDRNSVKMAVLSRYTDSDLNSNEVIYIDSMYSTLFSKMTSELLMQGALRSVFPQSYYNYESDKLVLGQSYDQILTQAKSLAPADAAEKLIYWTEILRIFQTANADSTLDTYREKGWDTTAILGPNGDTRPTNEALTALVEQASGLKLAVPNIVGTSGDDILNSWWNTTFQGAAGDDSFNIGTRGASFIYNKGDGADTIIDKSLISAPDGSLVPFTDTITINFGQGITFANLAFKIIPGYWDPTIGLIILMQNGDSITVADFNEKFVMRFADGTVKTYNDISTALGGIPTLVDNWGIGTSGNNSFIGTANIDIFSGGAGIDTVSYASSPTAINIDMSSSTDSSQSAQFYGGYASNDVLYSIENIIGSALNDKVTGSTANNILTGGAGNDTLNGFSGDDTLIGGTGADKLDGGVGIDTASYADSTAAVNVNIGIATAQSGGSAAGDTLISIENIIGSAYGDTLKGNSAGNVITGGAGADKIDGSTGTDTVSYATSAAGVNVNLGITTAQSGGDAAGDTLISIENIIGSPLNDSFISSSVANKLDGGAGIDTVSYASSTAAVNVNLGVTTAKTGGYAAGDTLISIENIIGSPLNDTLTGSSVANIISGGAGADKIDGGSGVDTVSYAGSNAAVNVNLAVTTAQSGGHAAGDTIFNIESIIGSSYNDTLKGTSIANIITGGSGNDTMTGGSGADVFKYSAITDSGKASGARDIITDFVRGTDKIDLADFAGTFTFKGTGALGGSVRGVNYAQASGNTIIGIDADGNGTLDLQIQLTGLHALTASDFLL